MYDLDIDISDLLDWLYRMLKEAKINLGRAESRPGVTETELTALRKKISYIDYLIDENIQKL